MENIRTFFHSLYSVISTFKFNDFIDIVISSFIIYKIIQTAKEMRAGTLFKGLILLIACYFASILLRLRTLAFAMEKLFEIGLLALIVVFQPELRRMLEKVGRARVSEIPMFYADSPERKTIVWEKAIDDICSAVADLSATKTGALIVIECKTRLGEQIDTGVPIHALTSKELFGNIFIPNTPLHDGAVIIRDGIILAAACFLPKPQNEKLIENTLGSRHRAAIGVSEISDAIVIIVSEETGIISIARDGALVRGYNKETLHHYLSDKLIPSKDSEATPKKLHKLFQYFNKKGKRHEEEKENDQQ